MKGALDNPRPVDDTPVNGQLEHGVTSNWAFDHVADLEAHTYNILETQRVGEYIIPNTIKLFGANAMVANQLYGVIMPIPRDITVDRIAIEVTVQDAGKFCRLGIYNLGTNLYPGSLLLDAGTVSMTGAGLKTITIDQALTKGIYFLVLVGDGTPTLQYYQTGVNLMGVRDAGGSLFEEIEDVWDAVFAYAALPDPFTAGGSPTFTRAYVYLRLASLD